MVLNSNGCHHFSAAVAVTFDWMTAMKSYFHSLKMQVFTNTEAFVVYGCSIEKRLEGIALEMVKFSGNTGNNCLLLRQRLKLLTVKDKFMMLPHFQDATAFLN